MNYFKHGGLLIDIDEVLAVESLPQRPDGGPPYHSAGQVFYKNGTSIETSFEFAEAFHKAVSSHTITQRA